jgi:hypothetical protein
VEILEEDEEFDAPKAAPVMGSASSEVPRHDLGIADRRRAVGILRWTTHLLQAYFVQVISIGKTDPVKNVLSHIVLNT